MKNTRRFDLTKISMQFSSLFANVQPEIIDRLTRQFPGDEGPLVVLFSPWHIHMISPLLVALLRENIA
jgi:hypothetical protein